MPIDNERLVVTALPAKYDRTYKATDRISEARYDVNLARLECGCADWKANRAEFPADDARRICAHLYDKLTTTKVERTFDPLLQLFIRYGRSMYTYRVAVGERGTLLVGEPFEPGTIRAIGVLDGKSILATYRSRAEEWSAGETDLSPTLAAYILERMRATLPSAFP